MFADRKPCPGEMDVLVQGSQPYCAGNLRKVLWAIRAKGVAWTLQRVVARVRAIVSGRSQDGHRQLHGGPRPAPDETLNLQAGELIEVKMMEEIRATLDAGGRNHGLLWMRGMDRYCGQRYRVFRRVNTILLESTGQLRKMKNTVLLDGLMCDGSEFFGCDRSCFYYWREVWLRRVPEREGVSGRADL